MIGGWQSLHGHSNDPAEQLLLATNLFQQEWSRGIRLQGHSHQTWAPRTSHCSGSVAPGQSQPCQGHATAEIYPKIPCHS